ncbi:hypothetical protein RR48_13236 [Papilio machaon]|uniref:Uncharacterized protein n=1 Tax=Papilio machaon TaxID=76193 RepID=A0A194QVV2_PAPMA|nr:hypothetical protein RR48_13236 [Papilio machaon]
MERANRDRALMFSKCEMPQKAITDGNRSRSNVSLGVNGGGRVSSGGSGAGGGQRRRGSSSISPERLQRRVAQVTRCSPSLIRRDAARPGAEPRSCEGGNAVLPEFAIPHRASRGDARIQAVACNLSRVPCACATCERVCRVPSLLFCPCTTAAKIRVKNRDPVPAYAMADADRDSDLGDDSPVILVDSFLFNVSSLIVFVRGNVLIEGNLTDVTGNSNVCQIDGK